jgi:hypothetical protein
LKNKSACLIPLLALFLLLTACSRNPTQGASCTLNADLYTPGAEYKLQSRTTSARDISGATVLTTTSANSDTYEVLKPTEFESIPVTSVRLTSNISAQAVSQSATVSYTESLIEDSYVSFDSAALSIHGSSIQQSNLSSGGESTTNTSLQSNSPAITSPASPVPGQTYGPDEVVITSQAAFNGGKPTLNIIEDSRSQTFTIEDVTVPAGTFRACKRMTTGTSTNVTFGDPSIQSTSELWTVGSGPCRGIPLKRVDVETTQLTKSTSETTTTEETLSLSLNGKACTP